MPTPPKKARRTKDTRASARKKPPSPIVGKEFDYVLQLGEEDARVLGQYHDLLSQGAAGFAETSYALVYTDAFFAPSDAVTTCLRLQPPLHTFQNPAATAGSGGFLPAH